MTCWPGSIGRSDENGHVVACYAQRRDAQRDLNADVRKRRLELFRAPCGLFRASGVALVSSHARCSQELGPARRRPPLFHVAVGEVEKRARCGIEPLARLKLLARRCDLPLGHELPALSEQRFSGRRIGVGMRR